MGQGDRTEQIAMKGSRLRRAIVIGVLFVVVVNVITLGLGLLTPTPGGPTSSSYATGADGLAAWAALLERRGRSVSQSREQLEEAKLDPDSTLVVLDPRALDEQEISALVSFAETGGRLVAGGSFASWTGDLLAGVEWSARPIRSAGVLASVPETAGVTTVSSAGEGSFSDTGGALPIVGAGRSSLAAVGRAGAGTIVFLADAGPLQNARLDDDDNAAFALGVVGPPSRPVVFAESIHGYGTATGLAALPARWKWALLFAGLAVLVMMWARARRLGPPDELARELPPPRIAYVDSLAGILARTGRRDEALAGLKKSRNGYGENG
jgi:Domain of unknown function (DUF4350)